MIEVEVGREPLDDHGSLTFLDERHLVLENGEWIKHIMRRLERDDLGVLIYRDQEEERFVIFQWVVRDKGWVQEIHGVEKPPDRGGWLPYDFMRLRCRSQAELNEDIARRVKQRKERRDRERVENRRQHADAVKFLKRRGKDEEAAVLASSKYTGDVKGGEELDQMRSALRDKAKGKVVVGPGTTGDRR